MRCAISIIILPRSDSITSHNTIQHDTIQGDTAGDLVTCYTGAFTPHTTHWALTVHRTRREIAHYHRHRDGHPGRTVSSQSLNHINHKKKISVNHDSSFISPVSPPSPQAIQKRTPYPKPYPSQIIFANVSPPPPIHQQPIDRG